MQEQEVVTTTLELIRDQLPCKSGYIKLVKYLGKDYPADKPINLLTILESNEAAHCLWAFQATKRNHIKIMRLIAADCAESVLHIYTQKYPDDKRPENAIKAAKDLANGLISHDEAFKAALEADSAAVSTYDFYAAFEVSSACEAFASKSAAAAAAAGYDAAAKAAAWAEKATIWASDAAKKEKEKQADIIRKYLKF